MRLHFGYHFKVEGLRFDHATHSMQPYKSDGFGDCFLTLGAVCEPLTEFDVEQARKIMAESLAPKMGAKPNEINIVVISWQRVAS